MKLLFFTLSTLAFFACTDAIKCYQGSISTTNVDERNNLTSSECTGFNNGQPVYCLKQVKAQQNIPTTFTISRYCSNSCVNTLSENMNFNECQKKNGFNTQQQDIGCCCQGDSCNSSNTVGISILVVFSAFLWNLLKMN